jgi:hypothetical protein
VPENAVIGAPRGARVPQGTSHKDFALFGAPSPSYSGRGTRRGKESACVIEKAIEGSRLAVDSPEPLHPGEEAMRDLFVGLIVALFIAGFMVYVYEPALFHVWLHRLLY